jgi:hypothetical protein
MGLFYEVVVWHMAGQHEGYIGKIWLGRGVL